MPSVLEGRADVRQPVLLENVLSSLWKWEGTRTFLPLPRDPQRGV